MTLITGNTYPIRHELKALGGKWNAAKRGWEVPDAAADAAWALVPDRPAKPAVTNPCNCGSGEQGFWATDARGIPLAKVCARCEKKQLARYRPEVLTNQSYECDEPIDADY